jgi:hypothetical protein
MIDRRPCRKWAAEMKLSREEQLDRLLGHFEEAHNYSTPNTDAAALKTAAAPVQIAARLLRRDDSLNVTLLF